jgi:spermidine synthase
VTIVEIEPRVLGVARTFASYNHGVPDHPKVRIVVNDGRNFLLTTDRTFDVITADPIHPWFRGAGYLYSTEYFRLAAAHLRPGGVIAQWLPIYELTPRDLASIVRTFREHFPHTLLFLTHYDAELVGSREPFAIDEAEIERRIAAPAVAGDLRPVMMGSATDLLSYFVMGTAGMARFAQAGVLNTDDNLYLEFSAPFSIANPALMAANVRAIAAHRESILPYLKPAPDEAGRQAQRERWAYQRAAAEVGDPALALFLEGARSDPAFRQLLGRLRRDFPWYAPGRFLQAEDQAASAMEPRLLGQLALSLANDDGAAAMVEVSSVLVPVSRTRASIMFVDNRARTVFGQVFVDDYERDRRADRLAGDVLGALHAAYEREVRAAAARGEGLPPARETLQRIRSVIEEKIAGARHAP